MPVNPYDLNDEFKKYLFEKYPDAFKKYDLAIYKIGEKPTREDRKPDINSQQVQWIIRKFDLFEGKADRVMFMGYYAIQLAKYFDDAYSEQTIRSILHKFKGFKPSKYNFKNKRTHFEQLLASRCDAQERIVEVFNTIIRENDISYFNLSDLTEQAGMPKL